MTGTERRIRIADLLVESTVPISAVKLASECEVSRQVIVQDIALLRASGYSIISTNKGYVLNAPNTVSRVIKVRHTDEQLSEELNAIVDLGGCVENVIVHHKVYGTLEAHMGINSRRAADEYMQSIRSGKSKPLKNITSDYHYHKITADSENTLDIIENDLKSRGFLIERITDGVPK